MPRYSYQCENCNIIINVIHSIDEEYTDCAKCESKNTMKKLLSTLAFIGIVACAPAHAGSTIVWGKVVDVKPVHTQIHQSVPHDVCKQVQVPVYGQRWWLGQ